MRQTHPAMKLVKAVQHAHALVVAAGQSARPAVRQRDYAVAAVRCLGCVGPGTVVGAEVGVELEGAARRRPGFDAGLGTASVGLGADVTDVRRERNAADGAAMRRLPRLEAPEGGGAREAEADDDDGEDVIRPAAASLA